MQMRITIEAIDEETGETIFSERGEADATLSCIDVRQWVAENYAKVKMAALTKPVIQE